MEDGDDDEEEDEDEFDAGGGVREEASLLGGEGVRARTSTTFRSAEAEDAAAVEAFRLPMFIVPDAGESDRLATPPARVAAAPVLGASSRRRR